MSEIDRLTGLCRGLGATPAQADAMARQLVKRADQLAVERGQTREQAMSYLLQLLIQGRNGEVASEFKPPAGAPPAPPA